MRRERFADYRVVLRNGLVGHQILLNVEPGSDPHVFDVEQEPNKHFYWQGKHCEQEEHHERILQDAHTLIVFLIVVPEERVNDKSGHGVVSANDDRAKDAFPQVRSDAEKIRQIAVDFVDQTIVIPGLPGPEPLPAGTADERADDNHGDPQDDETEEKCADSKLALLPGVIAAPERVGIYIRDNHEAKDDESRHNDAGDPGIEVNEHLLQAEEVPRRFRWI